MAGRALQELLQQLLVKVRVVEQLHIEVARAAHAARQRAAAPVAGVACERPPVRGARRLAQHLRHAAPHVQAPAGALAVGQDLRHLLHDAAVDHLELLVLQATEATRQLCLLVPVLGRVRSPLLRARVPTGQLLPELRNAVVPASISVRFSRRIRVLYVLRAAFPTAGDVLGGLQLQGTALRRAGHVVNTLALVQHRRAQPAQVVHEACQLVVHRVEPLADLLAVLRVREELRKHVRLWQPVPLRQHLLHIDAQLQKVVPQLLLVLGVHTLFLLVLADVSKRPLFGFLVHLLQSVRNGRGFLGEQRHAIAGPGRGWLVLLARTGEAVAGVDPIHVIPAFAFAFALTPAIVIALRITLGTVLTLRPFSACSITALALLQVLKIALRVVVVVVIVVVVVVVIIVATEVVSIVALAARGASVHTFVKVALIHAGGDTEPGPPLAAAHFLRLILVLATAVVGEQRTLGLGERGGLWIEVGVRGRAGHIGDLLSERFLTHGKRTSLPLWWSRAATDG
jgi:hypothetical protein